MVVLGREFSHTNWLYRIYDRDSLRAFERLDNFWEWAIDPFRADRCSRFVSVDRRVVSARRSFTFSLLSPFVIFGRSERKREERGEKEREREIKNGMQEGVRDEKEGEKEWRDERGRDVATPRFEIREIVQKPSTETRAIAFLLLSWEDLILFLLRAIKNGVTAVGWELRSLLPRMFCFYEIYEKIVKMLNKNAWIIIDG